jgi:O-antigen ligase
VSAGATALATAYSKRVDKRVAGGSIRLAVLAAGFATTVWFQPNNLDVVNIPKLLVVAVASAIVAGLWLADPMIVRRTPIVGAWVMSIFVVAMLATGLLTTPVYRLLWGAAGRNTGLVTYLAFAIIALAASAAFRRSHAALVVRAFVPLLLGMSLYGYLQWSGNDWISWNTVYNPVLGTLGNPNFAAAFLAITATGALGLALDARQPRVWRAVAAFAVLGGLVVIALSDALQGFVAFAGGAAVIGGVLVHSHFPRWQRAYGGAVAMAAAIGGAGLLGRGPLGSVLFKDSIIYRLDYWWAGMRMLADRGLTGVGIDSYGLFYREYRSLEATLRRGPQIVADAAHNVAIQFGATGGWPLMLSYLAIQAVVIAAVTRGLQRADASTRMAVGSVAAAWVAFTIQSLVSIDQIGLAVWGWILGGVLIGLGFGSDLPRAVKTQEIVRVNSFVGLVAAFITLQAVLPLHRMDATMKLVKAASLTPGLTAEAIPAVPDSHVHVPLYVETLARAKAASGYGSDVEQVVQAGLEATPEHVPLLNIAGQVAEQLGKPGEAVGFYGQALARDPHNQQLALSLGRALVADGKAAQARKVLLEALTLSAVGPDSDAIRAALEDLDS